AVERRQPGVFGDGDIGDQRRRRQAAFDEPRGRRRLDDRTFAGATGVFGTDRAQNADLRGRPVERLADLFSDLMHLSAATGTLGCLRLDGPFAAWKVFRQGSDIAPGFTLFLAAV